MDVKDFYYDLPEELIAQTPLADRASSRLLFLNRESGETEHFTFRDVKSKLRPGDCLVMNDTRVIPARIFGEKKDTGGAIEFVLLKRLGSDAAKAYTGDANSIVWEIILKPGKRARKGAAFVFGDGILEAEILDVLENGNRIAAFHCEGAFEEVLDKIGLMPLPPYIKEKLDDPERYQTVYARENGSAAAPTAGLHFTEPLMDEIRAMGVDIVFVTLHVGLGTFRPVKAEKVEEHYMHEEYFEISEDACKRILAAKERGGRVIAVGTTSCRVLESASSEDGSIAPMKASTKIFIYPGYRFKMIDGLITNFHLPESTLVMLVSAFAGREHVLSAYREAIAQRYRFFSFGDAMLIL